MERPRSVGLVSGARTLRRLGSRAMTGDYLVHGSLERAVAVVVPSFGRRAQNGTYSPGPSNEALAKLTISVFGDMGLPVFPQWEVYDAMMASGCRPAASVGEHGQKMSTHDASLIAARRMDEMGLLGSGGDVVVVAHPHHMPRADANTQAALPAGMETVALPGLDVPWDPESADWWTVDPDAWWRRERLAIGYFAARGWLDLRHEATALQTV